MKARFSPPPLPAAEPTGLIDLSNEQVAWQFRWQDGTPSGDVLVNRRTGRTTRFDGAVELALVFSAAVDQVAEPFARVADFAVTGVRVRGRQAAVVGLRSRGTGHEARLHLELDGPTRRKWIEFENRSGHELLLLDVELENFPYAGAVTDGGAGQPLFLDGEAFAAIEHPSGENLGDQNRVRLLHHPGRRLAPGASFRSQVALLSVAPAGGAREHFLSYLEAKSRPRPGMIGVYTPFGINNQWGACPALDDEQALEVLGHLAELKDRGVTFDYFTLDTGWIDAASDLTRFKPTAFPHGPDAMLRRVRSLHLKFGLWFATSWGLQSCWDYPGAFADGKPPTQLYREGFPLGADGLTFCLGERRYQDILARGVLHHVRKNGVRFLKFDGGSYACDRLDHGHLPGKYATEAMHEWLIDLARRARAVAPDVFIMWYWGLRSPFWALHGDAIFESGLHMEGSGTSSTPTLYYRDSVTLAQDQNAHHARNIPPRLKDSLGIWLSDTRWGNFMGGERWRESLVMDLGRGSRLFPNLWGNLRHLTDDDVEFLAWITRFARANAALFRQRRLVGGDPFRNEVYGYAHGRGTKAAIFLHNAHFAARPVTFRLDESVGLTTAPGAMLQLRSLFPDHREVRNGRQRVWRAGDAVELWLRPFETVLVEVSPFSPRAKRLPPRANGAAGVAPLGAALALQSIAADPRLDVRFADAALFEQKGLTRKLSTYAAALPALGGDQPILAVVIRLRRGGAEWKYAPTVVQIVQVLASVDGQKVQLVPVPDGRQHGNTQSFGCSWLVYKVRLNRAWSGATLKFAVHANLPPDVEVVVESWVVRRWWEENHRPTADGYYTYAPS
ncbi:MAG: hypothetical protein JSR48_15825 [Verrucomicrobia bacterium]|nr:hypothetical protein [Verrucomicrobiota bacterium]